MEVIEQNKDSHSLPLLPCESSVREKENPVEKKGSIVILKKVMLTGGNIKFDQNFRKCFSLSQYFLLYI